MVTIKNSLALTFAVLESSLFSGTIYGWASLVYVFKEDEIFGGGCSREETVDITGKMYRLEDNTGH